MEEFSPHSFMKAFPKMREDRPMVRNDLRRNTMKTKDSSEVNLCILLDRKYGFDGKEMS